MTVTVESQLENYILEKELGRNELGTIYQGRRRSDDALVTITIIARQFTFDEYFVRRFKETAKQTAKLEHPNIVRTYEAVQEEDALYLVHEPIEARPLAAVIEEEGTLSPQRMLAITRQIASALDYAHQKSVTHGDLSASHIYVGRDDHILVANFGLIQTMMGTSLVKQGYAVGSPETTAPERVHGQGPTRQSDLYSLGILCYQMLVGEPPFTGTPAAVLHAHAYEQPTPLYVANPGISVRLSEAIDRMLSKGLELRYNTGAEFARALSVAIQGTAPMRIPAMAAAQLKQAGLGPATPLWKRPWVWVLGLVIPAIIVLLVLGFWAVSTFGSRQLAGLVQPPPVVDQPDNSEPAGREPASQEPSQPVIAVETVVPATAVAASPTPAVQQSEPPTPTPIPTLTPTLVPLPTPGPPTVAENSPFVNLRLAHGISEDNTPEKVGTSFAPGPEPIYLFFDYANIEPGTPWAHRWTWGDTELGVFEDVWPDTFYESGTAWVFHSPSGGFQPGPYKVTLEIKGQVVATATYVIQPGGL